MGWRNRPTFIDISPPDADYTVFIDENGDSSMDGVKKAEIAGQEVKDSERYFTITACVMSRKDIADIREDTIKLKEKYWQDGLFDYNGQLKRVCFHSNEVRGRKKAFSPSVIDYHLFMNELSQMLNDMDIKLFSASIDKLKHYRQYQYNTIHPYNLSINFVLERIVKYCIGANEKCVVILEARKTVSLFYSYTNI